MKRFLLLAVATLAFVGCNNAFEDEDNIRFEQNTLPTLIAGFEDADTRTYVEDNFYLRWHEGDLISAFLGNTLNNKYIFKGETGENSGTFSAVSSAELGSSYPLDNIYAIYPYDENTEMSKAGVISTLLPAEQTYAEDSFGKGANTMVAVTESVNDTFLSFKNVGGYLKVKLYSDAAAVVRSITIRGNNGEKISGAATVAMTYGETPQLTMATGATGSITLDCGSGVMLSNDAENPTEFWFVVPPMEFSKGITISATSAYNAVFEKSTSNKIVVERNMIQPMTAVEVLESEIAKPANNEIWYTATKKVEPYRSDVFGATLLSNIYDPTTKEGVLTFDSDVTQIGDYAFYECKKLTSVTIPDSVTTIGGGAFWYCTSLTSVTIPDSVTTIGGSAFTCCESLTSVTIPDSVTTIGFQAFAGCDSLTSVTIGDSVTTIGDNAFRGCENLTSITIGDSLTTIGTEAFAFCNSLKEFKGKYASDDGRCLIIDGTLNSFAPAGLSEYTIPDSVTTIGRAAFFGCSSLTSVTIPDSVTTIGGGAFALCPLIKEFKGKFAEDNGRCLIKDNTIIAYAEASGTEYTIPDSVTTIGDFAFNYCLSLTSITIPDSVTTIGYAAFCYCYGLTSVTIGDSVTTIGEWAFGWCGSLTSITIGDSVTTIGDYAFYNYDSLTSVYCKATTPPTMGSGVFELTPLKAIYVPTASVDAYKTAEGWSNYASYIVGYDF